MSNFGYNYYLKHPLKLEFKRSKDRQQLLSGTNVNLMSESFNKESGKMKLKIKLNKKRIPLPQKPPKVISTKRVYTRSKDKKEINKEMDFID
ncbi:MAG: hypothetical protein STSR0008_01950 [Ignavibacterium sp.]